jgi:hypothetical protein
LYLPSTLQFIENILLIAKNHLQKSAILCPYRYSSPNKPARSVSQKHKTNESTTQGVETRRVKRGALYQWLLP